MARNSIRIIWDETTKVQWTGLLSRVPNSCYMHSWAYGEAIYQHSDMRPRRGIIYRSIEPIGVVQAFQKSFLFAAFTHTKIIRGPQWIEDKATDDEKLEAMLIIKEFFNTGIGSVFHIMPEMDHTPQNAKLLENLGFKLSKPAQTTSYLDLTKSLEDIKKGFNEQWLQDLETAEKTDFKISFSDSFKSIEWILEKYRETVEEFKIDGPSVDFIRCYLAHNERPLFVAKIVVVEPKIVAVEPFLAGALIVTHGLSATFLLGWCCAEGIEKKANHILLWRSLEKLQLMGIQSLDLGGIDMKNAHGITALKDGLSVKPRLLVGGYR